VIQLDNINKGEKMEFTPEEEAKNEQLRVIPVFAKLEHSVIKLEESYEELKGNDKTIIEKLSSLEIGQQETEERLDEGAGQFKLIWAEVKIMKNSIDKLGDTFTNGIEKLSQDIFNSKLDNAMSNNTKLAEENKELKMKLENKDSKDWDIKKIVIGGVMSLIIIALAVALGLKY
jgi:hypothetical protein